MAPLRQALALNVQRECEAVMQRRAEVCRSYRRWERECVAELGLALSLLFRGAVKRLATP